MPSASCRPTQGQRPAGLSSIPRHRRPDRGDHGRTVCRNDDGTHRRSHRFLFDIGGFTAASCAVSTLVEGVLGSLVYKKYKAGEMDSVDLFFLTAEAEILQMVIILMISKPLARPWSCGKIAVPMIVMNSVEWCSFSRPLIWYICERTAVCGADASFHGNRGQESRLSEKRFRKAENMEAVTDIILVRSHVRR